MVIIELDHNRSLKAFSDSQEWECFSKITMVVSMATFVAIVAEMCSWLGWSEIFAAEKFNFSDLQGSQASV